MINGSIKNVSEVFKTAFFSDSASSERLMTELLKQDFPKVPARLFFQVFSCRGRFALSDTERRVINAVSSFARSSWTKSSPMAIPSRVLFSLCSTL